MSKYFLISFYAPNFSEPYVQELPQIYAKDAELNEIFMQSPVCWLTHHKKLPGADSNYEGLISETTYDHFIIQNFWGTLF